jgi:hypothetical protein
MLQHIPVHMAMKDVTLLLISNLDSFITLKNGTQNGTFVINATNHLLNLWNYNDMVVKFIDHDVLLAM